MEHLKRVKNWRPVELPLRYASIEPLTKSVIPSRHWKAGHCILFNAEYRSYGVGRVKIAWVSGVGIEKRQGKRLQAYDNDLEKVRLSVAIDLSRSQYCLLYGSYRSGCWISRPQKVLWRCRSVCTIRPQLLPEQTSIQNQYGSFGCWP